MQLYKEPNKYAQNPELQIHNNYVQFGGYQKFELSKYDIRVNIEDKNLENKKDLFGYNFNPLWVSEKSVLDLGCNSAFFCYLTRLMGANSAVGIEIDTNYIKNVKDANNYLNFEGIDIIDTNVMNYTTPADLVIAFALIHWIYSCTSDYGSLDLAVEKLASLTNEVLLIEWIEEDDEAIEFFKHIDYNPELISEEYNRKNFENALTKHFSSFEVIGNTNSTRIVYIAYKTITSKKRFVDSRNKLNNKTTISTNNSYNTLKSIFLDLLNDNYLSENKSYEENKNNNQEIKQNILNVEQNYENFNLPKLLLNDFPTNGLVTHQMTNYVVLTNWELILANKDSLYNQTVEILLEENSFYALGEKLSYLDNTLTKVLVRNDMYIEANYLINEQKFKIIAYNSTSDLFPENLVKDLFSNTKLISFVKIPRTIDYTFYLIFKTVYILGASDIPIIYLLQTISLNNNYELEKYNLSNIAFLNSILKLKKYFNQDYNKLINSISIEYLYSPDYVLNSKVIDASTGRYYISRIYLNSFKDNELIITKQANYNLAHKEFSILSSLDYDYFPKVKNYTSHTNSSSFEMEFFDGSDLKSLLLNVELDMSDKLKIIYQLIQIAKILNNHNIEHRDINPENVIIYEGNTKLIDFGWAKLREENSYIPIGLNKNYSSYSINRKHIDIYSILLIIEEILNSNSLKVVNNINNNNLIGESNIEELINEINNLKKSSLTSTLRFTFSMLNILENLILTELAKAEKYLNVNMFSNDLTTSEVINFDTKNIQNTDNIEAQFYRDALYLYNQGSYLKAFEAINNALTINPENDDLFDLYIKINNKLKEIEIFKLNNTTNENNLINNSLENDTISTPINQNIIDSKNLQDNINLIEDINSNENDKIEENYIYDISIIIPVFNKLEYTKYCLDYLYKNTSNKYNWEVILIDNGSNDGTEEFIQEYFLSKEKFSFIRNSYNLGFAKACNIGIKSRKGKDVILLNNDTLPLTNWLEAIMEEIEADNQIGVAGSCLLYPNTDLIQHIGVKIGTEDGKTIAPYHNSRFEKLSSINNQSKYVSALTGAVLYIKSLVIDKIGLLDEVYINGLEDIDYCFKTLNAGFKIRYCAGSKLYHFESITDGRHKWDIQNWQRLNRNWLGKIQFDETQYDTIKEVNSIKQRELNIDNITKENIKKLPTYEILKSNYSSNYTLENLKDKFVLNENKVQYSIQESDENQNTHYYQNEILFSIIIPVHNNLELTKKCLNSIIITTENTSHNKQYEVIIIDNGSDLETQKYLKNIINLNLNFKLIINQNNEIYSKVNNQGAKLAIGKYLIFLNNDIELLSNWFDHLLIQFKSDENIGIQGAKLLYPNNKIQHAGVVWGNVGLDFPLHYHIYLTLDKNETCVNKTREYQFVTGAFLTIKRDLFNQVDGFDEQYVFGHEDLDLCLKVRQIGKKVLYNHNVEAIHYESQTKQLLGVDKFERFIKSENTYDLANHKYFLTKWGNILLSDAEKYFIEDGFWGLISDDEKRNEFKDKIVFILEKLTLKSIYENKEIFSEITSILFKSDKLPQNLDHRTLLTLSIDEINKVINLIEITLNQIKNNEEFINHSDNEIDSTISINNLVNNSLDNFQITNKYKKPLNILMTIWGWNESGGGTLLPKQLAIQLAKIGNNVTVIFTSGNHKNNNNPYYVENTKFGNIDIYGIYNRKTHFLNSNNPELDIIDDEIIKIYEDIIIKKKPEIVHYHNFLGFSLEIENISKKYNLKTIYSPHNYFMIDPNLYMINNDLKKWSSTNFYENSELPNLNSGKIKIYAKRQNKVKETLNSIDFILATSRKVGDLLSEIKGSKENVFLVNHLPKTEKAIQNFPIQINEKSEPNKSQEEQFNNKIFNLRNSKLRVGYIGGVMAHKGVHNLILASKLLKNEVQINIYGFVIESYKKLLDELQNQNLGLNNNIQINYLGEYNQKDISEILLEVDCIVVSSIWEDCAPLVLAEALSQNTPIIGANIGGIPDFVVNNFNGLLYNYDDFSQLAQIIDDIALNFNNEDSLLNNFTKNSKLTYDFDFYVNHIESIYLNLLNNIDFDRKTIELKFFDVTENNKFWEEKLYLSNNFAETKNNNTDLQKNAKQLNYIEAGMNDNNANNLNNEKFIPKIDNKINEMEPLNRITLDKNLSYGFSNNYATGKLPKSLPFPLKLNLGCGNDFRSGFINIDLFSENPEVVFMDIRNLEFNDNSVDYILANDVLEHFSHRETNKLLNEWSRILKPGGEIEIRCPNLKLQIQAYLRGDWNADIASYMIFGGQTNPGDYHCIGFDENSIKNHLAAAGFEVTYYEEQDYPQENGYINLNMLIKAKKLISELSVENSNSNSFTKSNPQKGTTYGENIDLDDNLNQSNKLDDTKNRININKNNSNKKHYDDINFEVVNLEKINKELNESTSPKINVVWEGTQFVYHSLALVNREQCLGLINSGEVDLTIIPYEANTFDPTLNENYHKLIANDIRYKEISNKDLTNMPYVWIRHQWPPKNEIPLGSKWILMQPWEFTSIRKDFVETFNNANEIWTPSNYSRKAFINSGIDPDKIQVIPNGINPDLFSPIGKIKKLNTDKKLKFLFVGGTIPRKGIDVLLSAYLTTFTAKDDVCLVIKDLGSDSFYKGQTAENLINLSKSNPNSAEIVYIDDKLSEDEMASLYRSCDVFISPYRGEGFSLPTLEAMACGLPVIVTKGGATDDYVDEEIGWQIPSEEINIGNMIDGYLLVKESMMLEPNEDAIKNIIFDIYKNPQNLKPLGIAASNRARKSWTWQKSTLKILSRLDYLYNLEMGKSANKKFEVGEDIIVSIKNAEEMFLIGDLENSLEKMNYCIQYFENHNLIEDGLVLYQYLNNLKSLILIEYIQTEDKLNLIDELLNTITNNEYLNKSFIDTLFVRVKFEIINNNLTEALEYLTICVTNWSDMRFDTFIGLTLDILLINMGEILFAMNDYEASIQIFKSGLEINQNNELLLFNLGLAYKKVENKDLAIKYFSDAIEINPNYYEAINELNELTKE